MEETTKLDKPKRERKRPASKPTPELSAGEVKKTFYLILSKIGAALGCQFIPEEKEYDEMSKMYADVSKRWPILRLLILAVQPAIIVLDLLDKLTRMFQSRPAKPRPDAPASEQTVDAEYQFTG